MAQHKVKLLMKGGLGNQLFQTLVGIQFARSLGTFLRVDTSFYFNPSPSVTKRTIELSYFSKLESELSFEMMSSIDLLKLKLLSRSKMAPTFRAKLGYISDSNHALLDGRIKSLILDGYFQDSRLLPSDEALQELLRFPSEISENYLEFRNLIGAEGYFAIHVRQGDYLKYGDIYNVLNSSYYYRSLALLRNRLGKLPVVLFSDDPQSAIAKFTLQKDVDFIAPSLNQVSSGEVLRLMAEASGIICANSTFSWWAAKLGKLHRFTSEVVLPERFTKGVHSKYQNFEL